MRTSILFVDDDPNIIQGLRRMLRTMSHEWDMAFVTSGEEALEQLKKQPFDVVVSDMRMPGMSGGQLLEQIRERFPRIVRIVLSGHSGEEGVLRAVGTAHQYLAKPCDADVLRNAVARACALRELLANEDLRALVGEIHSLPSLPSLYIELERLLRSNQSSVEDIARVIAQDVAMTAKILQLVNSAFFGLPRHTADVQTAVTFLGTETIRSLALAIHTFSQFTPSSATQLPLDVLWRHSLEVGAGARLICRTEGLDDTAGSHALLGGTLHDVGKLVLALSLADSHEMSTALAREDGITLSAAEATIFGAAHAEVGAYLLGLWGLPDPIVEAVVYHHSPERSHCDEFGPVAAVHVANELARTRLPSEEGILKLGLDVEYLARLNVLNRLDHFRHALGPIGEETLS